MTVDPKVKSEDIKKEPVEEIKSKPEEQKPESTKSQQAPEASKSPVEETQEQINWRKFRQEREKERREKAEADKRLAEKEKEAAALKSAMEAVLNKQQAQPQTSSDEPDETEDQRLQKKVDKIFEERVRQYDLKRQQQEAAELPKKLSETFHDFNQVCSQENIDYIEYKHPRIWKVFKNSTGDFEAWAGLYDTIKTLVPNPDSRKEQARIEKNLSKPQSMSIPGITQTGDHAPTELTEKRRQENWARMQRIMKGI